jgi:hypothetical protein
MKLVKQTAAILSLALLAMALIHCTTVNTSSQNSPSGNRDWSSGMQGLAKNLEKLAPYIFSREEFNDPKNRELVGGMIADLAQGAQRVPEHTGEALMGKDPILRYSLARLKSSTNEALKTFHEGQTEYSRNILRATTGLCFNCHSTQNIGPRYVLADNSQNWKLRISPAERADYYVATRQFDKATDALENVVRSPAELLENPQEQLGALKKYLFIQVRVKKDPGPAILVLDRYLSWNHLPYFMALDAQSWMDSLRSWQQDEYHRRNDAPLDQAKRLLKKADQKRLVTYDSGFVDYLRASQVLHESLRATQDPITQAQIYGFLGNSYENLSDLGTWDLPEVYYEACVRIHPKSDQSKKCYRDFERVVIMGFSGSAGTFVPAEERELLTELRKISE